MKCSWEGVFPAVTTQFNPDLSIDFDATARHIEVLIESGVKGLVMLGSLGENNTLLPDEKIAVVKCAITASNGRVPVLSGVSELSTTVACRYIEELEKIGADGAMVMPAMVYPADKKEAIHHFVSVAKASNLPIILYNNPLAYPVDLTPDMLIELAEQENFVAIKESSGNTRRFTDIVNTLGDRYTLFAGVDDLALECAVLGAKGWIAGIGLAFPAENQALWELMMAGHWDEAREIYRWYTPLLHLDVGAKFVQNIKLAIQEVGYGSEWVRAPRMVLQGAEREEVLLTIREGIRNRPKLPMMGRA